MVQIGNEINAGILWDDGKIADNASNWNNLAELLKAGCRAVKDVSPEIQTVLHVDDGSHLSMCQDFYANCIENGVDFDVIGLSYYTTWCGSLDQLSETMTALAERYGKPVCVVENSQPWCSGEYRGNRKVSLHRTGTEAISYRAAHQDQTGPRRAGYWIFCMGTVLD